MYSENVSKRSFVVNLQKIDLKFDGFLFSWRKFTFFHYKFLHGHCEKQTRSMNMILITEIKNSHREKITIVKSFGYISPYKSRFLGIIFIFHTYSPESQFQIMLL